MHRITIGLFAALAVALAPATAEANTCAKAYFVRVAVVKKFGKRAPGRDICRWGVRLSNGKVIKATYGQKKRYLTQLRLLNQRVPYAHVLAVFPRQRPAGTKTAHVVANGGSSNPMVNPACESGGDPQVWDPSGTYWGKYQFDRGTWEAHGGAHGSYGNAPEWEQDAVAARVRYDAWPNC